MNHLDRAHKIQDAKTKNSDNQNFGNNQMVLKTDINTENNQMLIKADANNENNQIILKADVNNQLLLTTDTNPNPIVLKADTHNASNNQILLTTDTNNINSNQIVLKTDLHMNNQILITDEADHQVIVAADSFIWKMLNISGMKEEEIIAIDQPQAQCTNTILELPTCETYEQTTDNNEAHGKYQTYLHIVLNVFNHYIHIKFEFVALESLKPNFF